MTLRWPPSISTPVKPASGVLLVQPLRVLWLDAVGQPQSGPPPGHQPVRVVADLIEENHVVIDVPPLMGRDRSGFIQVQLQSQLAELPLQAMWHSTASHPWLAKAFQINAVGVASQALQTVLDEAVMQKRPIQGVWPLSYLMAVWASKQAALKSEVWLLLCLALPHGLRMVLLKQGVPVFSRLLLDLDPQQQALEISRTLKYLADNRVLDRTVQPGVVLIQHNVVLTNALGACGVAVMQPFAGTLVRDALIDVLALAGGKAPGQLASPFLRRFFLLRQASQGLKFAGAVLALAGAWIVFGQSQTVMAQMDQTNQWQQQASQTKQSAQAIQQSIAASGVDTRLMRLAIEVKQRELQAGVDLPAALLQLAQLMDAQPQAELVRSELMLVPRACGGTPPLAAGVAVQAQPVVPPMPSGPGRGDGADQMEWQFEIRPITGLSPRARQQVLDALGNSVRSWPDWRLHSDPVQSASGAVIASSQVSSGPGAEWRWCLSPATKLTGQPS